MARFLSAWTEAPRGLAPWQVLLHPLKGRLPSTHEWTTQPSLIECRHLPMTPTDPNAWSLHSGHGPASPRAAPHPRLDRLKRYRDNLDFFQGRQWPDRSPAGNGS